MLDTIKGMIKRKETYLESAKLIFEDVIEENSDDIIFLGEADEMTPLAEDDEIDGKDVDVKTGDPELEPEEPSEDDDILSANIDSDVGDIEGDDLPTPIGAQTGEPIEDDIEDLFNVTIDLKSNTFTDILPTPPNNAIDAVVDDEDDIMNARIDSGFGDDEGEKEEVEDTYPSSDDILNTPIDSSTEETTEGSDEVVEEESNTDDILESVIGEDDPEEKEEKKKAVDKATDHLKKSGKAALETAEEIKNKVKKESTDDILSEAINIGGEAAPSDEVSAGTSTGGENEVTAAVKDKVAEAETETTGDDITFDGEGGGGGGKDELLKKLGNLTKSVEDAKTLVLKYVS